MWRWGKWSSEILRDLPQGREVGGCQKWDWSMHSDSATGALFNKPQLPATTEGRVSHFLKGSSWPGTREGPVPAWASNGLFNVRACLGNRRGGLCRRLFSFFYGCMKIDVCRAHPSSFKLMPFAATWMNLEIVILSEVSQTETNIIWHRLYVESKKKKKNGTNELICKTEIESQM